MIKNDDLTEKLTESLLTFLNQTKISTASFGFFIQNVRIFLEHKKFKKKYRIVFEYCNWVLHSKITKGHSPFILNSVYEILSESENKNDIIKKISKSLKISELILEFKDLFWVEFENKEPIANFDCDKNWFYFLSFLLESLMFKPLEVNNENIYIEKFGFDIRGIQIVKSKSSYVLEIISKKLNKRNKRIYVDIVVLKKYTNDQKK